MLGGSAEEKRFDRLPFFRITVLGPSGCGKTALINSFVNATCPQRHIATEKAVVYYKKLEIVDEAEYTDVRKPVVVEVEDTPGSEKGNEDAADDDNFQKSGSPNIRKGARVVVSSDKREVMQAFEAFRLKGGRVRYRLAMDGMLGKEFGVRQVGLDGSYGLPSPDGSEGGVWNFPPSVVKLKVALDMPVDKFLNLGEKPKPALKTLIERRKLGEDLQIPFRAYNRPIGDGDMDKSLTKNRMGYFLCFDISDDSGDSLKEAMALHLMVTTELEKRTNQRVKPYIWLVACKCDKNVPHDAVQENRVQAKAWSDYEEIRFFETSAKNHAGIGTLFLEMIQVISARTSLWNLEGDDDEQEEETDGSNCSLQ